MSLLRHINRPHKLKNKKGSGCKLCKPHKGKWASRLKPGEKAEAIGITRVIQQGKVIDTHEDY